MRTMSLNHSSYQHQYHLVWGTKFRRKFIKDYVKSDLVERIYRIIEKNPTLYIEAVNTDEDHIHIQVEIPPDLPVSFVVKLIKQTTSIFLRKNFKFIREMYKEGNVWSVGYFSSTVGLNESQIKKYIEHQGKKDFPTEESPL